MGRRPDNKHRAGNRVRSGGPVSDWKMDPTGQANQPVPLIPTNPLTGRPLLTVELVPSTCWFHNVRSEVSTEDWDRLKQMASQRAGRRCEVCGRRGPRWPVEAHEVWEYDDEKHVQRLLGIVALCPACH